jgi:acetyl esterase/lipase
MVFSMGALLFLTSLASNSVAADATRRVIELWPGQLPDDVRNMGAEKVVMSPALDRKQVEVTESTRMVTNVSRPTLTIYPPPQDTHTGTAILICPGGGYWNLYWQLEGEEVAQWLNSLGVTGIILKLAPWLSIPAGTPPIFLAHGGEDIISDPAHSVVAYLALKRAGVSAELHIYADSTHDFGVRPNDRTCSTWTQSCAAWLRQQGWLTREAGHGP